MEIKKDRRTVQQNRLMWKLLGVIAQQLPLWHGFEMSSHDYKDLFTAAIRGQRVVPNVDGNGFVALGRRTSEMNKQELNEVIEYSYWFGTERGVIFPDPALDQYNEYKEAQQ